MRQSFKKTVKNHVASFLERMYGIPPSILPVLSLPVPDGTYKGFTVVMNPNNPKLCTVIVVTPQKTSSGYFYDSIGFTDVPLKTFRNYLDVIKGSYKNRAYATQKAIFANFVNNKLFHEYVLTKYPNNDDWIIYGQTYHPVFCMEHKASIQLLLSRKQFLKPKLRNLKLSGQLQRLRKDAERSVHAVPIPNIDKSEALLELYIAQANYIVDRAICYIWAARRLKLEYGAEKFVHQPEYAYFTAHDDSFSNSHVILDAVREKDCTVSVDLYQRVFSDNCDPQYLGKSSLLGLLDLGYSVTLLK